MSEEEKENESRSRSTRFRIFYPPKAEIGEIPTK